jgi:hypothetical protein
MVVTIQCTTVPPSGLGLSPSGRGTWVAADLLQYLDPGKREVQAIACFTDMVSYRVSLPIYFNSSLPRVHVYITLVMLPTADIAVMVAAAMVARSDCPKN